MEVHVRPLNKGEIFCCSVKRVKEIFKETSIYLDFSYLGRDFGEFPESPTAYYWKRNIKGRIIATMHTHTRNGRPILSFYVLKETQFSKEQQTLFENQFLFKFYEEYKNYLNDDSNHIESVFMCVELLENKMFWHKTRV